MFKLMKVVFPVTIVGLIGWGVGMTTHQYLKSDAYKYQQPPQDVMFPKHPVIECKRSTECYKLAEAGYYEARGESDEGVMFVMQVIENRTHHPRWGNTIVDVVNDPYQFSYIHDGSLLKRKQNQQQWDRMFKTAYSFLNNELDIPDEWRTITHYHTTKVKPKWSKDYKVVTTVGNHIGYQCTRYC